jgi:hypothetical protein
MKRQEYEQPPAIVKYGWRYHHLGIPTDIPCPDEQYLEQFKMYVSGFPTSPYGIEWMRFEENSPVSELIRTVPHIAFQVDDLESALEGKEVLGEISILPEGIKVAMILDKGAPVELIEFKNRIKK